MDRTLEDLATIVEREVEDYARGGSWQTSIYALSDVAHQCYAVLAVPDYPRQFKAGIVVMARVENDLVFIEHDITDRPLLEELLRVGIPREQIICTYLGETAPTTDE